MTTNDKVMEMAELYFKKFCNDTSPEELIKRAYCAGYYDGAYDARADRLKEQEARLMGVTVNRWVARDKNRLIYAYTRKPTRLSDSWFILSGGILSMPTIPPFSSLTWESDPIEVTITVKPKKQ